MKHGNKSYRYILLVLVIALLLIPLPDNNLWWREAVNTGHTLLFFPLSVFLYHQLKDRHPGLEAHKVYAFVVIICLLLGVFIEVAQAFVHRDSGIDDIYRDAYGILAGLCFIYIADMKKASRHRKIGILFIAAGVGFLSLGLGPLIQLSWGYAGRNVAFPVIFEADSSWTTSFIHNDTGSYPGLSVAEPAPDWSGYQNLYLELSSTDVNDVALTLRVHDSVHNQQYSDRYNKSFSVHPGLNKIQIKLEQIRYSPARRELDLKNIAGLTLFTGYQPTWKNIEVKKIKLE